MEMRKCKDCNIEQPLCCYTKNGKQKGVQYYRHQCTACYTKQKRERRKKINDWYIGYKKSKKCECCGIDDFRVLEFHHIESTTKECNVSDAVKSAWSKHRILKEMKKCKILCANCHRIETWNEYATTTMAV